MKSKQMITKVVLFAVVGILCIIAGIKVNSYLKNKGVGFPDTYLLAAFDTTDTGGNDGMLVYYDENFKEVFRQDIPMGNSCDAFNPPISYKDKVYIAPQGQGFYYDVDEVLEIDRITGKQKKYKTNQHCTQGLAISQDYIFTVWNLNGETVLTRTGKKDGSVLELKYPQEYSFQLDVYERYLYCFIESKDEQGLCRTRCSILDINTMEEVASFDISDYGKQPEYTYMKDDVLYMPISYTSEDEYCGILLMYDTKTGKLNQVDLGHELPCQILEYEGNLVVTHANLVHGDSMESSVSIYNPETGHLENYAVKSVLNQAAIKDGLLYALDTQEQSIYVYDLNSKADALELKGSYKLKSKDGSSPYRYYTDGFFMR